MDNIKIKEITDFYLSNKEYNNIPTVITTAGDLERLMTRFNAATNNGAAYDYRDSNLFFKYYENITIQPKDTIDTIKSYVHSKTHTMGYSKHLFDNDQALINILRQFGESGLSEWCTYWIQFDQETIEDMTQDILDVFEVSQNIDQLDKYDQPTRNYVN